MRLKLASVSASIGAVSSDGCTRQASVGSASEVPCTPQHPASLWQAIWHGQHTVCTTFQVVDMRCKQLASTLQAYCKQVHFHCKPRKCACPECRFFDVLGGSKLRPSTPYIILKGGSTKKRVAPSLDDTSSFRILPGPPCGGPQVSSKLGRAVWGSAGACRPSSDPRIRKSNFNHQPAPA